MNEWAVRGIWGNGWARPVIFGLPCLYCMLVDACYDGGPNVATRCLSVTRRLNLKGIIFFRGKGRF